MVALIHEIIAEALRQRGLDRRVCYTHVAARPPDGATIEVECSDGAVAIELQGRFSTRAETRSVVVRPLPRPGAPELMLVVSGVGDVRREPAHQSELVSQVIHGDAVTPLKTEGDWVLVRLDDGYIGWIRDWHLKASARAAHEAFLARAGHRIAANYAPVLASPGSGAAPLAALVVGTPVARGKTAPRGWAAIELADGRAGFVRGGDIEKTPQPRPTPERLASTGLSFRGIPYLWGGTTPVGFDCSGLIQRIFRLHGVILPRDSDMQARFGADRPVQDPGELVPGDLVFFGKSRESITHVGLVLPGRNFLHSYGQVIENSLDPKSEVYSARLASIWQITRNPLASGTPQNRINTVRATGDPNLTPPKKR